MAEFSSRGLTFGDQIIKPDITAPGVDIVAARAAGAEIGPPVGDSYMQLSGTSMAAPHVAGAAALLLQQHPAWGAAELKAALMGSATFNPKWTVLDQGAGRVDVAKAVSTSFIAEPTSMNFGTAVWPHTDDEPIIRTLSYRNLGPAMQLQLTLDVFNPEGAQAPAGMFTVTPSTVSLPEGGTVSVTVTADTRMSGPEGIYSGRLVATDQTGLTLSAPLAVNREPESYDLVLRHIDRAGTPTGDFITLIVGVDQPSFRIIGPVPNGEDNTVRLPTGRYALDSTIYADDEPPAWFIAPNQVLADNRLLVMDARLTKPLSVHSPKVGLKNLGLAVSYRIPTVTGGYQSMGMGPADDDEIVSYIGEVGPSEPQLTSIMTAQWLDSTSTPQDLYAEAWKGQGRLPVLPLKAVDLRDMTVVHAHYAAPMLASQGSSLSTILTAGAWGGGSLAIFESFVREDLPYDRTEYYYSEGPSLSWVNSILIAKNASSLHLGMVPKVYRAHQTYSTHYNLPPFSLVLSETTQPWGWGYRQGDRVSLQVPAYSDRDGHAGIIMGEGNVVLYRNGEKIGESGNNYGGEFEVPPEPAEYRVELSSSQSLFEFTTHEEIIWNFHSAHVDEAEREALPLLSVRFTPRLNERGEAPRSQRFRLPIDIEKYNQSCQSQVSKPSVEVSYDDGATWKRANVERDGRYWNAILNHPPCGNYVSLRLSVHDFLGNAVEQTVIRAYALAGHH